MLKYNASQRDIWRTFRRALDSRDYEQSFRLIQGLFYQHDPWLDDGTTRFYHELMPLADETRVLFELLLFGGSVAKKRLEASLGAGLVSSLQEVGFLLEDEDEDDAIRADQYGLITQNGMYFIITFPHPKATDPRRAFRVYIGQDSFKLVHALDRSRRGIKALDICSGSGIIGQCLAPYTAHVDALELCDEAIDVSRVNAVLNGVEELWQVHHSDLYTEVADQQYDLIVTNPPFVAVPANDGKDFPIYGWGGEDGLYLIRKILQDAPKHLNPGGRLQMVFEGVGNAEQAAIEPLLQEYAQTHKNWSIKLVLYARMFLWERPMRVAGEAIANMQGDASPERIRQFTFEILKGHYDKDFFYTYKAFLIIDTDPMFDPGFVVQRMYNPWDRKSIPQRSSPVSFKPWTHQVMTNYWGTSMDLNDQQHQVVAALDGTRSIEEAAEHVWAELGGPMSGTTPGLFVETGLDMCRVMHQLGFLEHPDGHWQSLQNAENPFLGRREPIVQTFDAIESMLNLLAENEKYQMEQAAKNEKEE